MTDGVAAVMARMQALDVQLRTVDPTWSGFTAAGAGWVVAAPTDGQAVGSPAAGTASTSAAGTAAAGTAGASAAAGAVDSATFGQVLQAASTAGPGATPTDPAAGNVPTAAGGAAATAGNPLSTAALTPGWAIPPSAVESGGDAPRAASMALDTTAAPPGVRSVSPTAATAVAAGQGIGAGAIFRVPVANARVSQDYGPSGFAMEPPATVNGVRYAHFHVGIDYAAPEGTPVTAASGGVVVLAGRVPDGAVDVVIRHASGIETLYGHLQPGLAVHIGQHVRAGQALGRVGMTGRTTGPHLHFALSRGGVPIDPGPLLAQGILPGIGKGTASADGAGSASAPGGPNVAAFDAVAHEIPYAKEIRAAALAAGIDPLLLASLVKFESGFRASAVSPAGAMGLTQLMPFTARSLGVTDPFDPAQNLRGGARYLASNLRLYGRADLALAAYQAGRGSVDRAGGMPSSPTTRNYVTGIIKRWNYWLRKGSA